MHLKEEHGMNIDPNFINNIMQGMGEFFEKIMSGAEQPSDAEGPKELDPTLFFGKMMEQLFSVFAKGMKGIQTDDNDEPTQEMPNPFANLMQNIFGMSFPSEFEPETESELEPENDISSPSTTNEDDVNFQKNSIEIPFSTDDDKKKKDQKENNE
ncbi:MAG: hypothetical protein ACFFCD_12175 [Promethearchaeota archaeon]